MGSDSSKKLYFGVSLDPIECQVAITGFGTDERTVRRNARERHDSPYQLVVALDGNTGSVIEQWLRSCGIVESDAVAIRQMIGHELLKLQKESNAK